MQVSTRENNEGECIQSPVLRRGINGGREKKRERWGEKRRGKMWMRWEGGVNLKKRGGHSLEKWKERNRMR